MNNYGLRYTEEDIQALEALREILTRTVRGVMQTVDTTNDYDIIEA